MSAVIYPTTNHMATGQLAIERGEGVYLARITPTTSAPTTPAVTTFGSLYWQAR